jgi:hypothetical protein
VPLSSSQIEFLQGTYFMMSLYLFVLLLQAAPSSSQIVPWISSSHLCSLHYPPSPIPADQWISIFTPCLNPLVVHIVAGVSNPTIIGGGETLGKPPWSERLPQYHPVSILWRYYAIADRRLRSKKWTNEVIASTNTVFWDDSETIMVRSRTFLSKVSESTQVRFFSSSTVATKTMIIQGVTSVYTVVVLGSDGDVPTFFAPLAIIGLFRLQSAFWLSSDFFYLPFENYETPTTTTPIETSISGALYNSQSWRGVLFRIWWICSILLLAGYALFKCADGQFFDTEYCEPVSQLVGLVGRVFYTLITVGALVVHSIYVLRETATEP